MKKPLLILIALTLAASMVSAQGSMRNATYKLSWDVASTANTAIYRAEHYGVFVSTTNNQVTSFTHLFDETLSTTIPNWQPQPRELDISQFGGQSVYIAFRHYDVYDMDRVVIDNVKVRIVVPGQPDVVLLNEDFQAGIDQPAGESWLPQGWSKISMDPDTSNWYFAVRLGNATMRSQSYISGIGGINPDNWLITNQLYIGFVGNSEAEATVVSIYPNPASQYINLNSQAPIREVLLSDMFGKQLLRTNATQGTNRISVDHLPAGLYMLRLITDNGILDKKIQIQR